MSEDIQVQAIVPINKNKISEIWKKFDYTTNGQYDYKIALEEGSFCLIFSVTKYGNSFIDYIEKICINQYIPGFRNINKEFERLKNKQNMGR